jgi:RHS repeat-associated protein
VAVDSSNNIIFGGTTASSNLTTTSAALQRHFAGGSTDGFVVQLLASNSLGAATYFGGEGADTIAALALDSENSVYVTGSTQSDYLWTRNPLQGVGLAPHATATDAYAAKLTPNLGDVNYSTFLGGSTAQSGVAIGVDSYGQAIVGLSTTSGDLAIINGLASPYGAYSGGGNAALVRLDSEGNRAIYSTYLGGTNIVTLTGLSIDGNGVAYVAGTMGGNNSLIKVTPTLGSSASPMILGLSSGDSGSSAFDNITTSTSPTLRGIAAPSTSIKVLNDDGTSAGTATSDSNGLWTLALSGLSEGTHAYTVINNAVESVSNIPSQPLLVTVDATAPALTLIAPATTSSTRPLVQLRVSDSNGLLNGTTAVLDLDLNNDGDFLDAGESGAVSAPILFGLATFTLPSLSVGTIGIRARVTDRAGNQATSSTSSLQVTTTGSPWQMTATALTVDPSEGDALSQLGDASYVIPLDLDVSPGTSESGDPALIYHSSQVMVQPVIQATLASDNAYALPSLLRAVLTWDGTAQPEVDFSTTGFAPGQSLTLAVRPTSAVTGAGRHTWSLQVTADYGGLHTNAVETASGSTFVVALDSSIFGAGWSFSEIDKLVSISASGSDPAGELMVLGSGGYRFYRQVGSSTDYRYLAADSFEDTATPRAFGTLTHEVDSTWTFTTTDGTIEKFDSSGYESKRISPDGFETTTFTYSSGNITGMATPDGALSTITLSSGKVSEIDTGSRAVTLAYSGTNPTGISTPGPIRYAFVYDGSNHLTRASQFGNQVVQKWGYTNGMVSSMAALDGEPNTWLTPVAAEGLGSLYSKPVRAAVEDAAGRFQYSTLDGMGRPIQQQAADGSITSTTRSSAGWISSVTDALNRTTTLTRDSQGYVTQQTNPDGTSLSNSYQSAFHALISTTNERGNSTTFAYDSLGHPISSTDALGNQTAQSWSSGLLASSTDGRNLTTSYSYDSHRRLVLTTNPDGGLMTTSYDSNGNVASVSDPLGYTTTFVNDAAGRVTSRTNPLGGVATWTYLSGTSLLGGQSDEFAHGPSYTFDSGGKVISTNANGVIWRTSYDRMGRPVGQLAPPSPPPFVAAYWGRFSFTEYDAQDRVSTTTDALGNSQRNLYDDGSRLVATRDELGHWTQIGYDANRDWPTTQISPLGFVTTIGYDSSGNKTSVTNANGVTTTFAYDALNRLTGTTEASGTGLARTSTIAYDADSNISSKTDTLGIRTDYGYDNRNAVTTITEAANTATPRTTTMVNDADGRVIDQTGPMGLRTTFAYDGLGDVLATTDNAGSSPTRTSTFTYDIMGRSLRSTNALGYYTLLSYNVLGQVATTETGQGTTVVYSTTRTNGANSDLQQFQVYSTTTNGFPVSYSVTYAYDALGRLSETDEPGDSSSAARTTIQVRDAAGRVTLVLGPRTSQESRNDYDADSRLVRQWQLVDASGSTEAETQFTNDPIGNPLTVTDPLGRVTTTIYDALNRPVVVQQPLSKTTTSVYDAGDRLLSTQNALGQVMSYAYDVYNNRTQAIQDYGTTDARTVASVTYDLLGHITGQTDALNRTSTFAYDVLGRVQGSTDPAGQATSYTTDILGRVTEVTDALGRKTDTAYDAGGRAYQTVINAQLASGQQTTRTTIFDWRGNPLLVKLNGTSSASYIYNFWGQAETISDNNGYQELHYEAAGDVIGTRDGTSITANYITYTYDLLNRRTQAQVYVSTQSSVPASLAQATYAYDLAGEFISTTDRNGRRRDISYDNLGRATVERWYDNTGTLVATTTTTLDLINNVQTITDPVGTLTFTYDQYNRQSSSTDVWGVTLTNTYDNADERTVLTDSFGGVATWTYATVTGQLTQLKVLDGSGTSAQIDYGFNSDSEVNQRIYTGGGATITTDTGLDGAGRTTTLSVYSATRNIELLTYTYDVNTGLVSGASRTAYRTEADPSITMALSNPSFTYAVSFVYDSNGQVTSFGGQAYTYDGNGNITATGTQLGAGNRLLQDATWNYQYDLEGNLIQKSARSGSDIWNYSYDHLNRMIEAKETIVVGTTTYALNDVTYRYDALGRRVESVTQSWTWTGFSYTANATVTLRFSYDGQTLLFDLSGSNGEQVRYVQDAAGAQMLARIATSGPYTLLWYINDKDGAVIDVVDPSGRAIKRLKQGGYKVDNTYLATTEQIGFVPNKDGTYSTVDWTPPATLLDRFGFGGQEQDSATGLLYNGQGWYSQDMARFISERPGALDGTNAYRYPYNSPGNLVAVDANPPETPWGFVVRITGLKALLGEKAWNDAGDFIAGAVDRLTAGLTARIRQWLDIDGVDYKSAAYRDGGYVGQAVGIALNFVAPVGIAGLINTLGAVGGVINGVEALADGNVEGAVMAFGGAALAGLRGLKTCRWADGVLKSAEYGLRAFGVGMMLGTAWEKYQDGDTIGALLDVAEAGVQAYRYMQSCFAAGTPLLWEYGSKAIEKFAVGDRVWSRDENDTFGPLVLKVIEEVFVRTAKILHVQVRGQVIRTTAEHPFFVKRAWKFIEASELRAGDEFLSHDGQWSRVEEVYDTGEYETVYNLRVADFHTYFVGSEEWRFSVWVHNATYVDVDYTPSGLRRLKRETGLDKAKLRALRLTEWQIKKIRWLARKTPSKASDPSSRPLLGKSNYRGQAGDPAHKATVRRLRRQARAEFPDDFIHEGTSIENALGGRGLKRKPDVWVEDANSGRVLKVYEAARKDPSTGDWVKRERQKLAQYKRAGI